LNTKPQPATRHRRIGDAGVVQLGEARRGTREVFRERAFITPDR
jgi:erythromycin esterase-like protein